MALLTFSLFIFSLMATSVAVWVLKKGLSRSLKLSPLEEAALFWLICQVSFASIHYVSDKPEQTTTQVIYTSPRVVTLGAK